MITKCCLMLLAMSPIVSVSFAAKSALNVAQIRNGNASNVALQYAAAESGGGRPTEKRG